jgi:hypothetical protein
MIANITPAVISTSAVTKAIGMIFPFRFIVALCRN